MEDLDWGSVPPSRRSEVRRRIAILDGFAAIASPSEEDRLEAMRRLGIGRASFYRLIHIWKTRRDPALLPGANGRRSGRGKGVSLDPRIAAIIDEAIATVGAASAPLDLEREVTRLCEAAGLEPPSPAPIRRLRREKLLADVGLLEPVLSEPSVIVDSCALDLPAVLSKRGTLPVVTAAFLQPEGWIAAYAVEDRAPTLAIALSVLRDLLSSDAQPRALVLHPEDTAPWRIATEALAAVGVPASGHVRHEYGTMFGRIVGDSLGGLPLKPRHTRRPLVEGRSRYAGRDEALDRINEGVAIHNELRHGPTTHDGAVAHDARAVFGIGSATPRLVAALTWLNLMPNGLGEAQTG